MPAGKWDLRQKLDRTTGFILAPTGPLTPAPGELMVRVEAWIMQQKTGAVQMSFQGVFPTPGNPWIWVADSAWYPKVPHSNPPVFPRGGLFKPGPALGSAIAIATDVTSTEQYYYWWSQEIELHY